MKYSDVIYGNKNVVRAYQGDILVFERVKNKYIHTIGSNNGYIHLINGVAVSNNVDIEVTVRLMGDYIYNIGNGALRTLLSIANNNYNGYLSKTVMGFYGNGNLTYSKALGLKVHRNDPPILYSDELPIGEKFTWRVENFRRNTESNPSWGIYLFGCVNQSNNGVMNDYGFLSFNFDKLELFQVTCYEHGTNNVIYNFIPEEQNGDKGMLDIVHNIFYPCNDNDSFVIETE